MKIRLLNFLLAVCLSVTALAQVNTSGSQMFSVRGVVTDESGEVLPGAHIKIEGTKKFSVSNLDGEFSFVLSAKGQYVLLITYVGMKDKRVKFSVPDKKGNYRVNLGNIILTSDNQLEDVVVTGYSTMKKSQVAGAVSVVKAEDIKLNATQSIEDMLQGQIPGVNVMINSGDPGASAKIRIRGTSSILGNRSPLWVLDGVILSDDDMGEVNTADLNGDDAAYLVGNAIVGINPNDIEKITVLKDASATAIYGVQAANGVIVVTTKQGHQGKPQVSYSGGLKLNQRMSYGDLSRMNATERLQMSEEIIEDDAPYATMPSKYGYEGLYMQYINKQIDYDTFKNSVQQLADMNTDWYKLLFRNSLSHNHSMSISGASDNTRYYTSFGYDNTEGTGINSNSHRFTAMAKINSWLLKDKLYVGMQVNASTRTTLGYRSVNPNTYAYETSRAIPVRNADGSLFYYDTNVWSTNWDTYGNHIPFNILNELETTGSKARVNQITAQGFLQWNIWGGIQYKLQGSYQSNSSSKKSWATEDSYAVTSTRKYYKGFLEDYDPGADPYAPTKDEIYQQSPLPLGGIYSKNTLQTDTYILQNTLEFNHIFAKDHTVNLMGVNEIRTIKSEGLGGTYYGWMPDRGETFNPVLTSAYLALLANGSLQPYITKGKQNYLSWIFTASYSYKDKFVVNGNMRMDGSNQFGSNPKYRFLPIWSVSAKYTLSNEKFFRQYDWLSYLALRASYGLQGNVDSATSPDLVLRLGSINGITGLAESYIQYLPNPDLRWEKTRSYNVGLDLALFNNRLSLVLDVYSKRGTDMIMTKNVSQTNGFQTLRINAGKVNNSGVELGFTAIPLKTKNLNLTIAVNYSYNRNKLIDANESLSSVNDRLNGNALIVGEALGTIYSYDFVGLDHETGYPVFRAKDGSTEYKGYATGNTYKNYLMYQDEVNLVKAGPVTAPHQGGFTISAGYKGLRLSGNFTYQFGGYGRLPFIYGGEASRVYDPVSNVSKEYNNRWRQPGDEAHTNIPVLYNDRVFSRLYDRDSESGRIWVYPTTLYNYSTARIAKTDFLKLRSLTLSYIVPKDVLRHIGIQNLSLNLQATNLFTLASGRWEGSDPMSAYATTPLTRTYSMGVNITF